MPAAPWQERSLGTAGRAPVGIGRRLEADVVLDISVRMVFDRLIIISRLIDVRLERPIWAEAYVGTRAELLPIRRRLLEDALTAMGVELSAVERERLARGPTSSPEAFERYLEGRSRWSRRALGELVQPRSRNLDAGSAAPARFHPSAPPDDLRRPWADPLVRGGP